MRRWLLYLSAMLLAIHSHECLYVYGTQWMATTWNCKSCCSYTATIFDMKIIHRYRGVCVWVSVMRLCVGMSMLSWLCAVTPHEMLKKKQQRQQQRKSNSTQDTERSLNIRHSRQVFLSDRLFLSFPNSCAAHAHLSRSAKKKKQKKVYGTHFAFASTNDISMSILVIPFLNQQDLMLSEWLL